MRAVGALVGVLVLAVACSAPSDYRVVERDAEAPREVVEGDLGMVVDVPLGLPRDVALDDGLVAEASVDAALLDEGPVDATGLDASTVDEGLDAIVLDGLVDAPDVADVASEDVTSLDAGADDVRDATVAWDGDPSACLRAGSCAECFALVRAGASCGFCASDSRGTTGHCLVQDERERPQPMCMGYWFRSTVVPACGRL